MSKEITKKQQIMYSVIGILAAGLVALGYFYYLKVADIKALSLELSNTQSDLEQVQATLHETANELETEKYRNTLFSGQIKDIADTVGTLDKLAKTDKELLGKYSKVYFLNEHYAPGKLSEIPNEYAYDKNKQMQILTEVLPFLRDMIKNAARNGVNLEIVSAYRSFGEQSSLKSGYSVTYGSGANKFSADQGYSEHQLGTTIDFTTPETGASFEKFKSTKAYEWLQANAYRYGFVLSYPEGNDYYQFEPWHWRFVGRSLASRLHEENQNFYDLPQATINNYLINIFD